MFVIHTRRSSFQVYIANLAKIEDGFESVYIRFICGEFFIGAIWESNSEQEKGLHMSKAA